MSQDISNTPMPGEDGPLGYLLKDYGPDVMTVALEGPVPLGLLEPIKRKLVSDLQIASQLADPTIASTVNRYLAWVLRYEVAIRDAQSGKKPKKPVPPNRKQLTRKTADKTEKSASKTAAT